MTQADRCVLRAINMATVKTNSDLLNTVCRNVFPMFTAIVIYSIDKIKCLTILINVFYVHNRSHTEPKNIKKATMLALAIVQLCSFYPSPCPIECSHS